MNKYYQLILFTTIAFFSACEYDPSGSNFVELLPPEDNIPVEISLNDIQPSDTIYIYQNTNISIKITSPNDLNEGLIFLDEELYEKMLWGDSIFFNLKPENLSEGIHQLTVSAVFASGTGSLADMMEIEGYSGDLSWNIRVIHDIEDKFELVYDLDEDGFLKISWSNANLEKTIEKYIISSSTELPVDTIVDASQNFIIDSSYVCEYASYSVKIIMKDAYTITKRLYISKPVPELYFEAFGIDSLRIFWDKSYANGRFELRDGDSWIATGKTDTTLTIFQIYGRSRRINLDIFARDYEYNTKHNAYGKYILGSYLNLPNFPLYAYNKEENLIYSNRYSNLIAFDATSCEEINSIAINGNPWGLIYGGKFACAPHNSTVVAMTGEETLIYEDSRFLNPTIIPSLKGTFSTRLAALTSDDRFFVVQKNSNTCQVYNTLTGEKIFNFPFSYKTLYDIPQHVSVSEDGRYFCASSEEGIEVFEISDTTTTLLYTDTEHYSGAMFVPSVTDKILLGRNSDIQIRQLPDFTISQSLNSSGTILCNIDPASQSLLYYQSGYLKVCKISNLSEMIFKIKSDQRTCKMFNNKLLTRGNGGVVFDISEHLYKKIIVN